MYNIKIGGNNMKEFFNIEDCNELFKRVSCFGNNNCIFFTYRVSDGKKTGLMAGIEYGKENYDALLINANEYGIGFIPLKNDGILTFLKPDNMNLVIEKFSFYNYDNIRSISVKNFSFLNKKTKKIKIVINDGKEFNLVAHLSEKILPYHENNFRMFINKYEDK